MQEHSGSEKGLSERIAERVQLLRDIGRGLQTEGVIPEETVVLRGARLFPMVRGYFLLNQAYKGWRIEDGHNTEKPKIAALQAIVIARFQPFLPLNPCDARTISEARCNEILLWRTLGPF